MNFFTRQKSCHNPIKLWAEHHGSRIISFTKHSFPLQKDEISNEIYIKQFKSKLRTMKSLRLNAYDSQNCIFIFIFSPAITKIEKKLRVEFWLYKSTLYVFQKKKSTICIE